METFQTYFLQASVGIILFYLVYLLLLKNETYYRTNRYFLLAGLAISVILPLFPVSFEVAVAVPDAAVFEFFAESAVTNSDGVVNVVTPDSAFNIWLWILWIYMPGAAFFLFRLLWQTGRILWEIRFSSIEMMEGIKIINRKNTMPFSFFNVVFIDIQEYSERELSNIIVHERVHILERHWIDLLIIELMTVLFWVNPAVWLYERSIKQNHEYLADRGVLLAGFNPGQYQALLINQLMGVKIAGFVNNLNFSLNKKRMEMMKNEKSSGVSKMKLLLALPVVALLVFAFAKKEYVMKVPESSAAQNTQEVIEEPQFSKGIETATAGNFIHTAKTESENAEENNRLITEISESDPVRISGMVQNGNSKPVAGANILIKGTTTGTISDAEGQFIIDAPKESELVFAHIGYEKQIKKVSDLSEKEIMITLKESVKSEDGKLIKLEGTVKGEDGELLTGASVVIKNTSTGTVVDRNGKFELEVPNNSRIVISYIGYQTVSRGITSNFTNDDPFQVTYTLAKGVYNIELPKVDGDEIVEIPPPAEPLKGTKGEVYTVVEDMPSYKDGGMYGLARDLKIMTVEAVKQTADRGTAVVGFTVSAEGKVLKLHIVKSSGSAVLDDVAKKFVQKLDNWKPGSQRGKNVSVDLTVPVKFE